MEICCEDITVCELVEKYLKTKTGVTHNTRTGYKFVQNILAKEPFGQKKIASVKTSDAKIFLINMQKSGKGYSTICTVRGVLRPAFQMAADGDMIIKNRPTPKVEPIVDGYSRFLFLDKNGKPKVALYWEKYFQLSVEKHNKIYCAQLPKITPHVCRHTFCTNMAKSGMNPKVLQYIMGHGDISVTFDTYTHMKAVDAIAEMERLDFLSVKEA